MKCKADLMMELLVQHMEHVEKRVNVKLYALGQVNLHLENILEGFSTMNENLSTIVYGITKGLKS
jgi:hypothetical protein